MHPRRLQPEAPLFWNKFILRHQVPACIDVAVVFLGLMEAVDNWEDPFAPPRDGSTCRGV